MLVSPLPFAARVVRTDKQNGRQYRLRLPSIDANNVHRPRNTTTPDYQSRRQRSSVRPRKMVQPPRPNMQCRRRTKRSNRALKYSPIAWASLPWGISSINQALVVRWPLWRKFTVAIWIFKPFSRNRLILGRYSSNVRSTIYRQSMSGLGHPPPLAGIRCLLHPGIITPFSFNRIAALAYRLRGTLYAHWRRVTTQCRDGDPVIQGSKAIRISSSVIITFSLPR